MKYLIELVNCKWIKPLRNLGNKSFQTTELCPQLWTSWALKLFFSSRPVMASFCSKTNLEKLYFFLAIKFEVLCVDQNKIVQFPKISPLSQIFSCKEWFWRFFWHDNFCNNLCDLLRPNIHNHYECVMVSVHDNRETAQWWLVVGIILVITCSAREQYLPWSTSSSQH